VVNTLCGIGRLAGVKKPVGKVSTGQNTNTMTHIKKKSINYTMKCTLKFKATKQTCVQFADKTSRYFQHDCFLAHAQVPLQTAAKNRLRYCPTEPRNGAAREVIEIRKKGLVWPELLE
jgi:hypothetical protein